MPVPEHAKPRAEPTSDPGRWLDDYGDLLFGFAMARVRNHHVAEDLVQETLVAACKARDRFEGRSTERSWLVGILKNKLVDYFRKRGREQSFTDLDFLKDEMRDRFDEDLHWLVEKGEGPTDWSAKASDAVEQKEFWEAFHLCAGKLPPRIAQAFLMREVDGVGSDEICSTLSLTKANFWVMLHRARMALRQCLEEHWIKAETEARP
jgi:RNA polymerase sigma-70 factor (ECF subfamily)